MRADFLANASHELRTPLASLSGFIETLQGPAKGDAGVQEKFLGIMHAQADRMRRLVDDLLSLSRIELNEHIRPDGEVDLRSVVRDVADSLAPIAQERGVRVEVAAQDDAYAPVTGDRHQIVQVVQNLVDNGLKYAPDGSCVRVEVGFGLTAEAAAAQQRSGTQRLSLLTPDRGPEAYGVVRVTDQGRGLEREHLPRLTERFYRVEGQKSGERQGTGLGLAIVKHIVNRHRGGLAVESAPGEGATFSAYFPMRPSAAATERRDVTEVS
jgi:two-component system phosphate regulon sensor histidine kinase PhoR